MSVEDQAALLKLLEALRASRARSSELAGYMSRFIREESARGVVCVAAVEAFTECQGRANAAVTDLDQYIPALRAALAELGADVGPAS